MPYFRKTPEEMAEFGLTSRHVSDEPPAVRAWMKDTGVTGDENLPVGELRRSREYTSGIIEAVLTNVPFSFNGNVMNTGLITNLPDGCCVEVPVWLTVEACIPVTSRSASAAGGTNRSNIAA